MTTTTYTVKCEDGRIRHAEPFPTLNAAMTFADWGHCCTSHHIINPVSDIHIPYAEPCAACEEYRNS